MAPFSAVDADPLSGWRTGYFEDPVDEWLEVRFDDEREIGEVALTSAISNGLVDEVTRGGSTRRRDARGDRRPVHGPGRGRPHRRPRGPAPASPSTRRGIRKGAPIWLLDVDLPGPPATRTLVVPPTETTDDASYVFTARPEVRTCITTLIAPDCNYDRGRLSDESLGLDRIFTVPADGTWSLTGTVVARARSETAACCSTRSSARDLSRSMRPRRWPRTPPSRCGWPTTATGRPAGWPIPTTRSHHHGRLRRADQGQPPRSRPAGAAGGDADPGRDPLRQPGQGCRARRLRRLRPADHAAHGDHIHQPDPGLSPIGISELYLGPTSVTGPSTAPPRPGRCAGSARRSRSTAVGTTPASKGSWATSCRPVRSR